MGDFVVDTSRDAEEFVGFENRSTHQIGVFPFEKFLGDTTEKNAMVPWIGEQGGADVFLETRKFLYKNDQEEMLYNLIPNLSILEL
ncbi:hypothetical protein B9Z55_011605 [Caenorhabditis nigoni]|uniref:Uncharacterized protein n=1 Tax=Caenorhabditis nigoni TaxID=1611254 RepID=A0A2G5UKT1_9PELO|nr:hypothetical protein B9Z55_011605 [Caenorhabditis nigoni]